ncbi:acetate--CoA ligase family protein [Paradesulfitobacterium ferrireducens]|uniref:acetate--CoA ligase family protein n=1 Tax=Paradesulfitobacterium ferrireducens TaxID=2816476 RepID=UPI001A8E7EC4|nr:acetate--CoA ligase family protein [Paradesulfitobacterium ferrireducens]
MGLIDLTQEAVEAMLRPKSIAVVGAKDGLRNIKWLQKIRYDGIIYPVHPTKETVDGLTCYPSLLDVPGPIDAVVSLVRAELVPDIIDQAAAKQAKVITVYAAPVSNGGQISLEQVIRERVMQKGVRVVGPNALGILNIKDKVTSGYSSALAVDDIEFKPGSVAVISASGGLGDAILIEMLHRKVGVNYLFHPGNEADLTISDLFLLAAEQQDVGIIALYIEGIRDVPRFIHAAHRALEQGKIVVALKVGKTEAGKRAAYGHTGAIMASDDVFNAFCKRYGIVRVEDASDLITTVQMFASAWPQLPSVGKLAMLSASGGVTTLLAEAAEQSGTPLAEFTSDTAADLGQLLKFAHLNNPLDLTGQVLATPDDLRRALHTVADDKNVAAVLYGIGLAVGGKVPATVVEACSRIKTVTGKPVAAVMLASSQYKRGYHLLEDARVPLFRGSLEAAALTMKKFVERSVSTESLRSGLLKYYAWQRENSQADISGLSSTPNEREVKTFLAAQGLPVAKSGVAGDLQEAIKIAGQIGYPVVLKALSRAIVHKTEAGVVRVGIKDEAELTKAYQEIANNLRVAKPGGVTADGMLVEEYVEGIEALVGFLVDESFGPVVTIGSGGIYVEVLKDLSWRLAPVFAEDAADMIGELKVLRSLLKGVRGADASDFDALVQFISNFSQIAFRHANTISMLEVNPLKILPKGKGVKVVDARVSIRT